MIENNITIEQYFQAKKAYNKGLRVSLLTAIKHIVSNNTKFFLSDFAKINDLDEEKGALDSAKDYITSYFFDLEDVNDWKGVENYLRYNISLYDVSFNSFFQSIELPETEQNQWSGLLSNLKTLEIQSENIKREKLSSINYVKTDNNTYITKYKGAYIDALNKGREYYKGMKPSLKLLYISSTNIAKLLLMYDTETKGEQLTQNIKDQRIQTHGASFESRIQSILYTLNDSKNLNKENILEGAILTYHKTKHIFDSHNLKYLVNLCINVLSGYASKKELNLNLHYIREYIELYMRYTQQFIVSDFLNNLLSDTQKRAYENMLQKIFLIESFSVSEWIQLTQNPKAFTAKHKSHYLEKYKNIPKDLYLYNDQTQFLMYSLTDNIFMLFNAHKDKKHLTNQQAFVKDLLQKVNLQNNNSKNNLGNLVEEGLNAVLKSLLSLF